MKNLIILTTIVLALLTLTGCGGGNQAQQAAPNQADNGGQQVQGNQQANTPAPMRRNGPADTGATTQIVPQNSNIDFKKMTDDQIDQKYDQLKKSNSTTAIRFGLQAWASRFQKLPVKNPLTTHGQEELCKEIGIKLLLKALYPFRGKILRRIPLQFRRKVLHKALQKCRVLSCSRRNSLLASSL